MLGLDGLSLLAFILVLAFIGYLLTDTVRR
jgi:hypothetical protein